MDADRWGPESAIYKSTDAGATWNKIKSGLPKLLFAGTEFGLYFTIDGGQKWIRLKAGMPTIAVRDLAIQKRMNDLVVGTFGRGIYVLDDYTPLRDLKPETLEQGPSGARRGAASSASRRAG